MMSPVPSPMPPSYYYNGNDPYNPAGGNDGETTSLMQRNYLSGNNNGNNNNATARRRSAAIQQLSTLDPYYVSDSASFSPPQLPINRSEESANESSDMKEHGRKFTTNRIVSSISSCFCSSCRLKSNEDPNQDTEKYYRDDFNDGSWSCTFGTSEDSGIWMNTRDQAGTILALTVWFLLGYSAATITFLAQTGGIPSILSMFYCTFCALALASHAKTHFTDPGSVPQAAVPHEALRLELGSQYCHSMCSQCQTYKPPFSHHCRICNRCVSRMDHHCPWMNNCIGSGNLKHFILFLVYTWICSAMALMLLGWNYFVCADEDCMFTPVLVQLVRVMSVICVGAFFFTSSMIMNVWYGIVTGIGTIDRLKKKANATIVEADEEPIDLIDIFGIGEYYTWLLPSDPIFEDYDRVVRYSTPQRLLREQLKENPNVPPPGTPGTEVEMEFGVSSQAKRFIV